MVSPQNPTSTDVVNPATVGNDRGFVREEVLSSSATAPVYTGAAATVRYPYPVYFWGSVVAGTLLVMSIFVLSYFLMLGLHVGVDASGALALGWGAAIWLVVTSCIAYYFGGLLASQISSPLGSGWLKGTSIWGLSIPLVAVIGALVMGGTGLFGLITPQFNETLANAGQNAHQVANNLQPHAGVNFGFIWTAFTILICGLIFAILGSGSALPVNRALADSGRGAVCCD